MELNDFTSAVRHPWKLRYLVWRFVAVAWATVGCGENTAQVIVAVPMTSESVDAGRVLGAIGRPVGFAELAEGDLQTTTGGGVRLADFVTSCSELQSKLEDTENPRVVVVTQAIDCRRPVPEIINTCERACGSETNDSTTKVYRVMLPDAADCGQVPGGSASDPVVTKIHDETIINVASNKTLIGQGPGAAIAGVTLYIKDQSNVIIQNMAFSEVNSSLLEAGDAITIDRSDHVWVDHCAFVKISDGFVDAINGSLAVTISWNLFDGANADACAGQHNYANNIEGSNVTFHHNFYDHTLGYSPKISRASRTHFFNNYWRNVLAYSIQVSSESQALIQSNDFEDSKVPYHTAAACFDDATPCGISAPDDTPNMFEGISADETHDTGGTVDPLPYDASTYSIDDAAVAKLTVIAKAGATLPPQ